MNILENINLFNFNQTAFEDILKIEVEKLVNLHLKAYETKLVETYYFDDCLLSREEVAQKLGVSIGTVDNLKKRRKITSSNIGTGVKYKKSEILRYIKSL